MAHARGGTRQRKEWTSLGAGGEQHMTGTGTFLVQQVDFLIPGTVLRMLGEYALVPTAAPADADFALIGVGIGLVSTDASTLGSTAMPDPGGDTAYPWLYWASHALHYQDTGVDPSHAGGSLRKSFDVGSMRRFSPLESLVMVVEYTNGAGNPPITFVTGRTRVLVGTG